MEIIRKNISIYGHATLSAGLGGLIGHYSSSTSLQQGATIGLINGLTCTFISSQWENKTSQLYSMASLAFLILAARTLAPLLKGRVEVPSTSTLLLLAIPSTLFSMIHRSPSPENDKETLPTSVGKKSTSKEVTSNKEEIEEKKEKFIEKILAFFKVNDFSRHLRRYPPAGRSDTKMALTEQQAKDYQNLIDELKSLLSQDQHSFLKDMDEETKPLYEYKDRPPVKKLLLESELSYYLKKVFPGTDLHLLSVRGYHALGLSYKDEQIISVSEVIRTENVLDIEFRFSNRGNPILLQQGRRGCTAACTAMLIYQYDSKLFDQEMVNELRSTNLGNTESMTRTLERYGLTPVVTERATLEEMQKLLSENGSAIVSVSGGVGGHVVMLDKITDRGVIVRDPYHGWEITLTREAFEDSFGTGHIQLKPKKKVIKEKKKELIPKIQALFEVDGFSKHLRRFPPVGSLDTTKGLTEEQSENYRNLIDELKSLLPQDQHRFLEEMPEDAKGLCKSQTRLARSCLLELELAYYLKKIFPGTDLHLLSNMGPGRLGLYYKDEQIISVSKVIRKEHVLGIEFRFSERGKPILLQQGRKGCTAACTAMLIYQYDSKLFDQEMVNELYSTNLGNTETMTRTLERYGLTPVVTECATLEEMQKLLSENGSAIVSVKGGHVVMLDEITDRGVIVRDPYHGWEITLTREAFEKSLRLEHIQVSSC